MSIGVWKWSCTLRHVASYRGRVRRKWRPPWRSELSQLEREIAPATRCASVLRVGIHNLDLLARRQTSSYTSSTSSAGQDTAAPITADATLIAEHKGHIREGALGFVVSIAGFPADSMRPSPRALSILTDRFEIPRSFYDF
ncbi:unnamed protein product, partial [Iphiclides podalirius]